MKKGLSVLLAILTAFSLLTAVFAVEPEPLLVYDLLKCDADGNTKTCRTIEIFFQRQFRHYDSTKEITFRTADGTVVAVCKPYDDNNRMFDLYAPDGTFGVVLDPTRLYYLTIPEGAYTTDEGYPCAAYRGEYDGVRLSDTGSIYTVADLCISDFLATDRKGSVLYAGRLRISTSFDSYRAANTAVTLIRKTGVNKNTGEEIFEVVGFYPITAFKKGSADVAFGGVEIDRYATYELHVDYGTFFKGSTVINGHSEFRLSGKRLLGLREDYPAIDLLIWWFGADHWTVKAIVKAAELLSKVGLVDKALAGDIKNYADARKSA